jgi:branched-subunit amino acid transport protein
MKLWLLIVLMAIVTYLPRLLPLWLMQGKELPKRVQTFLSNVPYAALGALIFPGVLNSTGDIRSSLAGGITAVVLAYCRVNVMIVVLCSIAVVYLWSILAV